MTARAPSPGSSLPAATMPPSAVRGDAADVDGREVEAFVRRLLESLDSGHGPAAPPQEPSALFAIDIDGVEYSLVCHPTAGAYGLSPREQEISRLVAQGLPNKCVGAVLQISSWTVATYLRRIFAKLGVNSRAAMVARLLDPTRGPAVGRHGETTLRRGQ